MAAAQGCKVAFWANVVITPIYDGERRLRGFAKITRDLTARRKVEELQRGERQTNEFLAMLAHELRNPLSPIQSALDVAKLKPDDLDTAKWAQDIIARQTRQLSRLVDDLLDVSRVTRSKISLKRELLDLRDSVDGVIQSLRPAIDARRLSVAVALPEEPVIVNVDPTRMAQVLSNILGNAIKYTPDGGNISVRASASDGLASLAIADDGIGMAADLVPRVFDLFVQGDRALDRREGGLGVGLTIAKRLIDLQGGTLTAASDGPGTGSSFTLGLPLAAESTGAELTAAPQASSTLRRVFIVDDNHDAAEALAALIGALGHDVRVADNGQRRAQRGDDMASRCHAARHRTARHGRLRGRTPDAQDSRSGPCPDRCLHRLWGRRRPSADGGGRVRQASDQTRRHRGTRHAL